MARVRSASTAQPESAELDVTAAYRLAQRAQLLGFLADPQLLTTPATAARFGKDLAAKLAEVGVGRGEVADLKQLLGLVDANPQPDREWVPLRGLLGDELLGRLLGISQSSLARYAGAHRPTPDVVAARLHVLAMVCADLRAGYNEYGIRRWFVRPRPSLEGASVADVLGPVWDPDGPAAGHVRELAASVLSIGAT